MGYIFPRYQNASVSALVCLPLAVSTTMPNRSFPISFEFLFPEDKCQRCTVHFYRNVFSVTPRSKVKPVAKMLKAIHAAREKVRVVVEEPRAMKLRAEAAPTPEINSLSVKETMCSKMGGNSWSVQQAILLTTSDSDDSIT